MEVQYEGERDFDIFRGINFSIELGEKIAFVGFSGSGKSTLISLLLRLYDYHQGSIFIDGMDIRNIKIDLLLSQTAIAS